MIKCLCLCCILLIVSACEVPKHLEEAYIGHLSGMALDYERKNEHEKAIRMYELIISRNINKGFDVYKFDMFTLARYYYKIGDYESEIDVLKDIRDLYDIQNKEKDKFYLGITNRIEQRKNGIV